MVSSFFCFVPVSPLPRNGSANSGRRDNGNRSNSNCNGYAGARPRSYSNRVQRMPSNAGEQVQLRRRLVFLNANFFVLQGAEV